MGSISLRELHHTTGDYVRQAGSSPSPIVVTEHGRPVAVLAHPSLLKSRRRQRTLLPEYTALMAKRPGHDLRADLDAVRGDR